MGCGMQFLALRGRDLQDVVKAKKVGRGGFDISQRAQPQEDPL